MSTPQSEPVRPSHSPTKSHDSLRSALPQQHKSFYVRESVWSEEKTRSRKRLQSLLSAVRLCPSDRSSDGAVRGGALVTLCRILCWKTCDSDAIGSGWDLGWPEAPTIHSVPSATVSSEAKVFLFLLLTITSAATATSWNNSSMY
jgi:hypothetical protein